jgi:hypothetical protein
MATKEKEAQNLELITDMKRRVHDILTVVTWREIANNEYTLKSPD